MWNRLISVVEEQAQTLLRTAFSTIVREAGDLSAGVFDLRGRMLAQAVTGHAGPRELDGRIGEALHPRTSPSRRCARATSTSATIPGWAPGICNDFVLTTPCFHRGKLVALFSCTSHLMDIGGIGFGPDGFDVFMEGLYIPMLKLADAGTMNQTLLAMIRANTRLPVDTIGDVYSLANCNEIGCRRLVEMMDEFDLDDLDALGEHICRHSERAVREEIARLPKGTLALRDDARRLRRADHAGAPRPRCRTRHPRRLHGHLRRRAARDQRARSPTRRPTRASASRASSRRGSPTTPGRSRRSR